MATVAAIAGSSCRRRGLPPRWATAATSRPQARATLVEIGCGTKVASTTANRSGPARPFVVIAGKKRAEMQFSDGYDADCRFYILGRNVGDQDRCVE